MRKSVLAKSRASLLCSVAFAVSMSVAWTAPVSAQAPSSAVSYSIRPQSLGSALASFADKAGLRLLFPSHLAAGRSSAGLSGSYTQQQALSRLLAGTGLAYDFTNANTVTIFDPRGEAGASLDGDAVQLETIDVVSRGASALVGDGWQGDPEKTYEVPAGVSVVTSQKLERNFSGNISAALRSTPGTFTRDSDSPAGIGVNIRGLEGFGRVNMMIDGVRQNFRIMGHGVNGASAYVDPSLLASMDIARGAVSGVSGIGALAGMANFRTLDVDDIIRPGRDWGITQTAKFGSNGYNGSTMTAGAVRRGGVGAAAAFSYRKSDDYRVGRAPDGRRAIEPGSWQELTSGLAKLNFEQGDHRLSLGAVLYSSDADQRGDNLPVTNQTYTAKYAYNPDSDLVNLRINTSFNITEAEYESGSATILGATVRDEGLGFDLSNTSFVALGDAGLTLSYGGAYYRDDVDNGGSLALSISPGTQEVSGLFAEAVLNWNIFDLIAGLRYDRYAIEGQTQPFVVGDPTTALDVDNTGDQLSPKITLAAKVLPWLQVYGTYEHSFRPPSLTETLFPGFHGAYSGAVANPNLKGESSKGWEAGVNISKDNTFIDGDAIRLKFNYFDTDIENYVAHRSDPQTGGFRFINVPGETPTHGIEIEGGYDAGFMYATISYTDAETALPHGLLTGTGAGDLGELPEDYLTLGGGIRLLDRTLTLGAQMRKVGPSKKIGMLSFPLPPLQKVPGFTVYDVHADWRIKDNVTVFMNVENITDVLYEQPLKLELNKSGRGRTLIGGMTVRF